MLDTSRRIGLLLGVAAGLDYVAEVAIWDGRIRTRGPPRRDRGPPEAGARRRRPTTHGRSPRSARHRSRHPLLGRVRTRGSGRPKRWTSIPRWMMRSRSRRLIPLDAAARHTTNVPSKCSRSATSWSDADDADHPPAERRPRRRHRYSCHADPHRRRQRVHRRSPRPAARGEGHDLVLMSRDARPLADRFPGARVVAADLLEPATLAPALDGRRRSRTTWRTRWARGERGFAERDRQAARNFALAAARRGVAPDRLSGRPGRRRRGPVAPPGQPP